jgi:hypothetical protein
VLSFSIRLKAFYLTEDEKRVALLASNLNLWRCEKAGMQSEYEIVLLSSDAHPDSEETASLVAIPLDSTVVADQQ